MLAIQYSLPPSEVGRPGATVALDDDDDQPISLIGKLLVKRHELAHLRQGLHVREMQKHPPSPQVGQGDGRAAIPCLDLAQLRRGLSDQPFPKIARRLRGGSRDGQGRTRLNDFRRRLDPENPRRSVAKRRTKVPAVRRKGNVADDVDSRFPGDPANSRRCAVTRVQHSCQPVAPHAQQRATVLGKNHLLHSGAFVELELEDRPLLRQSPEDDYGFALACWIVTGTRQRKHAAVGAQGTASCSCRRKVYLSS